MNISDAQVAYFKKSFYRQFIWMIVSLVRLMLNFIFVLPGNLMSLPLSAAVGFYAERERIKALKASSVKIKA